MKFKCPLVVVNNIDISRNFYEGVLNQKVKYDFGENILFEGDFSIQLKPHFAKMVTLNQGSIVSESNSFELYFEEEKLDSFVEKLESIDSIRYLHKVVEHPWGQRVIRFYDPDMHIIEVGESMETVVKRFLAQGLSLEETVERTQHPLEFVKQCL